MNCKNCGAPLEYLWTRECFYCGYCKTYSFPEESADGIKVVGEESRTRCPACQVYLEAASVASQHVLYCTNCRGILAEHKGFLKLIKYLRARASGLPDEPIAIDHQELRRRIRCPHCDQMMDVHPYYGPGNIVIDTCIACGVIWLDHGELRKIRDAPGRDRGRPQNDE